MYKERECVRNTECILCFNHHMLAKDENERSLPLRSSVVTFIDIVIVCSQRVVVVFPFQGFPR